MPCHASGPPAGWPCGCLGFDPAHTRRGDIAGRWLRVAAVLGIAQTLAILLSAGNAEGEWYWSYILMVALHFSLLVLAPAMSPTSARVMAVVTISYGSSSR
ncbi:MAG: hypothetical protein DYH08_00190 [Actinobacteria bacterium ATB1]|nr:hypothetical protein [Actinobacteria bacterium ATB1]